IEKKEAGKISFYDVIPLQEDHNTSWKLVQEMAPQMPKGWFELSRLPEKDRIEFIRSFWLDQLPFIPHNHHQLHEFFNSLDDVGVFIVQWDKGLSCECEMVYSLKDDSCFYHGAPPISQADAFYLREQMGGHLPLDYLSFLQIHSGFSKHSDSGLLRAQDIPRIYKKLLKDVVEKDGIIKCRDRLVDPRDLIPFYESFDSKSFQCFLTDWYPDAEMGNVFFSLKDHTISDFLDTVSYSNTLAFRSFLDWLCFYLESLGV
ncbi:MAG: SMI1/KNR4 family protein, partial [Chlamydiae bacterium]|nr:SMI1/KNR4 family protein [Chlamydiota bacterium]